MASIPLDLQKNANGGGPPDSSVRIRPRLKSQDLKGSIPSPTRAKEKSSGLSRRASGPHLRCERRTEATPMAKESVLVHAFTNESIAVGTPVGHEHYFVN